MGVRLYAIPRGGQGRLWTMAAPAGGDDLASDLSDLRAAGVDVLVSMLNGLESRWLGLAGEAREADAAGLDFRRLSTNDFGTPRPGPALALARHLRGELNAGRGVAVHCRGGIGRSSLLAAIVLRLEGVRPDQAWEVIGRARGARVPDTQAQRNFVDSFDLHA